MAVEQFRTAGKGTIDFSVDQPYIVLLLPAQITPGLPYAAGSVIIYDTSPEKAVEQAQRDLESTGNKHKLEAVQATPIAIEETINIARWMRYRLSVVRDLL